MRKWRVRQQFYLGEESRIKAKDKTVDSFLLGVGTIIYESVINDRVIINGRVYNFKIGKAFWRFCDLIDDIPENQVGDTNVGAATVNLKWVGPADLVEVVPGTTFMTPDHFYEETLAVAFRGVLYAKDNEDGFNILDDRTFELKRPFSQARDWLMVGYVKK
jgi:hypothetical protein